MEQFHYFREAINHLHFLRILLFLEKVFLLFLVVIWLASGASLKLLIPVILLFLFFMWIGWENYYQHEQNIGIQSRRLQITI